jgi:hypothetical protein
MRQRFVLPRSSQKSGLSRGALLRFGLATAVCVPEPALLVLIDAPPLVAETSNVSVAGLRT